MKRTFDLNHATLVSNRAERKLKLDRETLRALTVSEAKNARGGVQTLPPILQTKIGNTCDGASCFPTCAPQ